MDGVTSVFVTVATIYSGNVSMFIVLIIGLAKLASGAIAMGVVRMKFLNLGRLHVK